MEVTDFTDKGQELYEFLNNINTDNLSREELQELTANIKNEFDIYNKT